MIGPQRNGYHSRAESVSRASPRKLVAQERDGPDGKLKFSDQLLKMLPVQRSCAASGVLCRIGLLVGGLASHQELTSPL